MNCLISAMIKIVQKKSAEVTSSGPEVSKAEGMNINGSMKKLLVSHDGTTEDKIATVKAAQMVDKERFESAFKTLMKR